jgi:long-chain acyl-CoA synthetase
MRSKPVGIWRGRIWRGRIQLALAPSCGTTAGGQLPLIRPRCRIPAAGYPAQTGHLERTGYTPMNPEPITLAPADRPANLVDLVHRTVQRHPDREALRWKQRGASEWTSRTYRELWGWVETVSLGLQAIGMRAGDRAVILSHSRAEWVVADLASLALGAVTCPIFSGEKPDKVDFMVRNVAARFVFAESAQQAAKLRVGDGSVRVIVFDAPSSPTDDLLPFDQLTAGAATDVSAASRMAWRETWEALDRESVATIVHTSGTSGEPKGVVLTHGNVIHNYEAAIQVLPFDENDLALSVLPLSHMLERAAGMYVPLGLGTAVAFAEPLMERWASNLAEVRPTVMVTVPLFFQRIHQRVLAEVARQPAWKQRLFAWGTRLGELRYANHLAGRRDSLWLKLQLAIAGRVVFARIKARTGGRLRFFASGGAPLPREVGEFFYAMGMLILEGYGLSETAPFLAANRPGSFKFGSVGLPVPGTEIRIEPATGEILARGPQVMRGYLDAAEDTAKAIDPDGWFHTGDIGEFDEAGRLTITDRIKNLIVLDNGKKVSPTPMEIALVASPYIAEAVVIGDGQSSTGALLVPDFHRVLAWARESGLDLTDADAAADATEVHALIEGEARRLLREFAAYERPRKVALLPRELSEEHGEVAGALRKPKRRVIVANWPDHVARVYSSPGRSDAAVAAI